MFRLALFERLAEPDIPAIAVKTLCQLIAKYDLRYPHALGMEFGADCWPVLNTLCEAKILIRGGKVLKRYAAYGPGRTRMHATMYRIAKKWWLTADEIAQEVDKQEKMEGREALFEGAPREGEATQTSGKQSPDKSDHVLS